MTEKEYYKKRKKRIKKYFGYKKPHIMRGEYSHGRKVLLSLFDIFLRKLGLRLVNESELQKCKVGCSNCYSMTCFGRTEKMGEVEEY